jgi:hypothetical protein
LCAPPATPTTFGILVRSASSIPIRRSGDARYITGQNIVLDGGQTLGIPGSLEG